MVQSRGRDGVERRAESSTRDGGAGVSSSCAEGSDDLDWGTVRGIIVSAGALWLVGFKEACQFDRPISCCKRSRPVLRKTVECFFLNGCVFLGSILILQHVVVPTLGWFLGSPVPIPTEFGNARVGHWTTAGVLQTVVVVAFSVLWLYPVYIFSFICNIIWSNDIAKHAFRTMDNTGLNNQKVHIKDRNMTAGKGSVSAKGRTANQTGGGLQSVVLQIGEHIYSVIMVTVFFVEVFVASYIPYVGPLLNFVLLSWLYAYYCFDYKWSFAKWSLERRLIFFETNWAFFAGFGSPCVLATFFLPPLVSAGVMNILFPLFVLVAMGSNPEEVVQMHTINSLTSTSTMKRLPIFYLANIVTVPLLRWLQPAVSTMPSSIQSRKISD